MINKGDTIDIVLDYQYDGKDITEGQFDEIEFQLIREFQGPGNRVDTLLGNVLANETHLRSGDLLVDVECELVPLSLTGVGSASIRARSRRLGSVRSWH